MDSEKTLKTMQAAVQELTKEGSKLYSAYWMEKDKMSNDLLVVSFDFIQPNGSAYSQSYFFQINKGFSDPKPDKTKLTYDELEGLTEADFDPATIVKYYEDAKAQMPEGYTYRGISDHTIRINEGNGEKQQNFTLMVTEDGNEKVKSAGQTVIEYYELKFNVDKDGTVTLED